MWRSPSSYWRCFLCRLQPAILLFELIELLAQPVEVALQCDDLHPQLLVLPEKRAGVLRLLLECDLNVSTAPVFDPHDALSSARKLRTLASSSVPLIGLVM